MFNFTSLHSLGFALGAVSLGRYQYKGYWQFEFLSSGKARQAVGALRAAGHQASFFTLAGVPIVQVAVPCTVGFSY